MAAEAPVTPHSLRVAIAKEVVEALVKAIPQGESAGHVTIASPASFLALGNRRIGCMERHECLSLASELAPVHHLVGISTCYKHESISAYFYKDSEEEVQAYKKHKQEEELVEHRKRRYLTLRQDLGLLIATATELEKKHFLDSVPPADGVLGDQAEHALKALRHLMHRRFGHSLS